jgi:K+-sensing histidine kinase KdpD
MRNHQPSRTTPASLLICLVVAAALVAAFTLARAVLNPVLGSQSPFMLYIAAVLIAGFARGALCGFSVMLGAGAAGLLLFSGWDGRLASAAGPLISMMLFWMVSALALMMANELRRHANAAFERMRGRVEASRAQRPAETSVPQRAA